MNSLNKVNEEWVPLQAKVFTRWVSSLLKRDSKPEVKDVTKDLSNGVILVELAEILTHKKATRAWDHDPKNGIGKVQNCDLALDMFEKDGVKLVGISGKDISDNNEKLIFGLIWSLILHYYIGNSINYDCYISETNKINNSNSKDKDFTIASNSQNELIAWANKRTQGYEGIENFEPYDLSMCALLDSYCPEKVKYSSMKAENHKENAQKAVDVMNELEIPCFVYPEDLEKCENKVDRMTLLTQLAAAKSVLDVMDNKTKTEELQKEARLRNEEDAKIRDEQIAKRKEDEEKIKAEQRSFYEQQEKLRKEKEEAIKAENERILKEEEEARLKAQKEEEESRARAEKAESERIERMRNEQRAIEEENERIQAEEEARLKDDEEALINAETKIISREEQQQQQQSQEKEKSDVSSSSESELNADAHSKSEDETRIKEAEQRADKAEQEKRELEEKLKEAQEMIEKTKLLAQAEANAKIEEEREKMKQDNEARDRALEVEKMIADDKSKAGALSIDNVVAEQAQTEKKDKHIRIRIKVHAINKQEAEKKLKVGIRIRDNNNDGLPKHFVCKNLKVTTKKNGKVIPSKIDGPVTADGEVQAFHVKLF